ncbi:MAG: hypothetical protein OEZ51_08440 [Nitrospinota bacterium]|nr:hypothetical protein [Nitrospinota bacterium]
MSRNKLFGVILGMVVFFGLMQGAPVLGKASYAATGFSMEQQPLSPDSDEPLIVASDHSKKTEAKQVQDKKPEKEEEGFLTKTLRSIVGEDDPKKEDPAKGKLQKTVGKQSEKEEEEGFLTKALKSIVGEDDKDKKETEKNALNPINMAPTGSAAHKEDQEQPKTAKSETKEKLKDSFEKLIGVGAVKDQDATSEDAVRSAGKGTQDSEASPGGTKSARKEDSGGLLDGILGGEKARDTAEAQQAKVDAEDKPEVKPAATTTSKPRKIAAQHRAEDEDREIEDNRGVKKGKNVLKESFKTLLKEEKKEDE